MRIIQITFFFSLFLFSLNLCAQLDFNDFKNLKAEGGIPADFTISAYEKIKTDVHNDTLKIRGNDAYLFLEGVHYSISDLLHSGKVVYGDEVSTYVGEIADKLLAKNQKLRKKLRFYTIKTNETNAFSTFQGIIFVTTGLISQLENEAQLAYILSHEIAHYTEDHVILTFDRTTINEYNSDKIGALSKFSKENEFEADRLGIKLYNEAGYTKEELVSTFDVLLYSYLPFEEIEFPKTYLNSDLMTIPESFYPKTKFPIKAEENEDDSKSSHPNIKKRKEAVQTELNNYKDWGNDVFPLGENRFIDMRTVCRFESVRTDIIDAQFDDALYSIFILEKDYSNSIYLKRLKAKAWLGMAQYKSESGDYKIKPSKEIQEGEIAVFRTLLNNLNRRQMVTVSLRMIEDVRKENPDDVYITKVWERMVKTFSSYENVYLDQFSDTVFHIPVSDLHEELDSITEISTLDSSFYLHAISDLLTNDEFKQKFTIYQNKFFEKEKEQTLYANLPYKEKLKLKEEKATNALHLGLDSFIYLEPIVFSYNKYGVDRVKSEKLQIEYANSIAEASKSLDMKARVYNTNSLSKTGTDVFNQRSVLMSLFLETLENDKIEVFPTDYNLLQEISKSASSDKVIYSFLIHENKLNVTGGPLATSIILLPSFFVYFPSKMMQKNKIIFTTIVIDLAEGQLLVNRKIESKEPINKYTMLARVYETLYNFKKNSKNKI